MLPNVNDMFGFVTQLMTEHAAMFETLGLHMFKAFAIILVAWFGIKSALGSASGGQVPLFHFDSFASLLLTIAFGFGMLTFYTQPIPGFGVSFSHLIVDQGLELAGQLNHSIVQEVSDRLTQVYLGLEQPGTLAAALNVIQAIYYSILVLSLIAAGVAIFVVISFGYVAVAVAVMLGPVFIPFFIVPHMEWLFWGWFKALFQYAFYPVVANAYLFVFGNLLIHLVDAHPPPYDSSLIAVIFLPLVCLLVAFTYGILKIPSLVNSLFTGKSGEAGIPRL